MPSARLLLTGATGFVGRSLLLRLREAFPDATLRALVRDDSRPDAQRRELDGVEWLRGDLESADSLARAVAGATAVVHAAAQTGGADAGRFERTNVAGTRRLATACRAAGVRGFVLLSSSAVYGAPTPGPSRSEDASPRPASAYGRSKLAAEDCAGEALEGAASVGILRCSEVYGPRAPGIAAILAALGKRRFWVTSPGDELVRPAHLDDVAAAVLACLGDAEIGIRILNVAGERTLPREEYRDRIAALARIPRRRIPLPAALAAPAAGVLTRLAGRSPDEAAAIRSKAHGQIVNSALDTRRIEERYAISWKPFEPALLEAVASLRS